MGLSLAGAGGDVSHESDPGRGGFGSEVNTKPQRHSIQRRSDNFGVLGCKNGHRCARRRALVYGDECPHSLPG